MISPSLLRYHMEGLSKFITILPGAGGSCQFITILQWGGGPLGTPNLYYVIYGRPLKDQARAGRHTCDGVKKFEQTVFASSQWKCRKL